MDQPAAATEAPASAETPTTEAKTSLINAILPPGVKPEPPTEEARPAEEAKKEEASKEDPKKDEKGDDLFATKFAALARKEKAVQESLKQMKAEQAKFQEAMAELEKMKAAKAKAKEDPWAYLREAELDYEYLTKLAITGEKPAIESKMKHVEDELTSKVQALDAKLQEIDKREQEAILNSFKSQMRGHIASKPDQYELLLGSGEAGFDLMYDVIEQHAAQTGEVLSFDDAAKLTEDYLEKDIEEKLAKLTSSKKLQKFFKASEPPAPPQPEKKSVAANTTLTNQIAETPTRSDRPMTQQERLMEAAKLLKFNT